MEGEVSMLKAGRDLHIGLNEERRLKQIKITIEDATRRSNLLENEAENIIQRWQGRIVVIQKQLEEDAQRNQGKIFGDLIDKYIAQIFEKNRKMVEIQRVKEEIETKIQNASSEDDLRNMQEEVKALIN